MLASHFSILAYQLLLFLRHGRSSHGLWPEENSKHFPKAQHPQACCPVPWIRKIAGSTWSGNGTCITSLRCIVNRGSRVNMLPVHPCLGHEALREDALSHRKVTRCHPCPFFYLLSLPPTNDVDPVRCFMLRNFCFCFGYALLSSVLARLSWIAFSLGATLSQLSCWKTVLSAN